MLQNGAAPYCQPRLWAMYQANGVPVHDHRNAMKPTSPIGAMSGAANDDQSRRRRMATTAAQMHGTKMAMPTGSVMGASAARHPANTQRLRRRARIAPATSVMNR